MLSMSTSHVVTLKPHRPFSAITFPTRREIKRSRDLEALKRIRNRLVGLMILQLCATALAWLVD